MQKESKHKRINESVNEPNTTDNKTYLSEQDIKNIEQINNMQKTLSEKKDILAELELSIEDYRDKAYELEGKSSEIKKEIRSIKNELRMADLAVSNDLSQKYGKFRLGENNEIIKVD